VSGQGHPDAEILAAGTLLYTYRSGRLEVALIHRPKHDDWTFPKGKLEPGEHVLTAAVREVTEETGIRPVLGPPLATVRYRVEDRPKRVDYWAARVDSPQAAFVPNEEVDALEWLAVPEATSRLTYPHDVRLLEHLGDVTRAGPSAASPHPASRACILLRHAPAGRKSAWTGDDLLRPLDGRGLADAEALVGVLACYAPQHVISSAAERCLGTVRPYAEWIGAAISVEPAFTVRGHGDRSEAARERISRLISEPAPMVVCAHRENLPVLLAGALAALGEEAPGGHGPAGDWSPPKSGFWVLHVTGGTLTALEHHDLES